VDSVRSAEWFQARNPLPVLMTPSKTTPRRHPARLCGVVASRLNAAVVAAAEPAPAHDRLAFMPYFYGRNGARRCLPQRRLEGGTVYRERETTTHW
jgi:hypothetical protein